MKEILVRAGLSRRSFLKRLAAGGATALVGPRLSGLVMGARYGNFSQRIGLLLPVFRTHRQIGRSFVDGMRLFMAQEGPLVSLRLFASDACSQRGLTGEELIAMCSEERLDLVVSLANPTMAPEVRGALAETDTPLLISHAGANRLDGRYDGVFYNTLGYWQASYAAGQWAARALGSRAAVVSSFYESGYDALYAFEEGLEAGGGVVGERLVTNVPGRTLSMTRVIGALAAARSDFVYVHMSGAEAADFVNAYRSSRYTRQVPMLASTFLFEAGLVGAAAGAVRDVYSVSSWSPLLGSAANAAFCDAFEKQYGRKADSFAALGYDTAGLLVAAGQTAALQGVPLADALAGARTDGPRGLLVMDGATQSITPPLYLRRMRWQGSAYEAEVVSALTPVKEPVMPADLRSGWIHPYLTI